MYYNNKFKKRTESHRAFSDGYSKPSFRRSNRGFGQRKSQLEGADINMFIKKASPVSTEQENTTKVSFEDFNLIQVLKTNIKNHAYIEPTLIQAKAITPILEGRDVIGLASTGTGKTAAFLIPLIHKLFTNRDQNALIIVPTRELAVQINAEFRAFSASMHIYSALLIGGANLHRQTNDLRRQPQVVIATPGRLKDLIERRSIYLADFQNIVLDEVDLMVDIGFINDVKYFISLLPKIRQSLFFSATISAKVQSILQSFVTNPITISVKTQPTSENVNQDVIKINNSAEKLGKLHDLLTRDDFDKVLVFLRTKHSADKLYKELEFRGFRLGVIHGNKSQSQRQRILQSFKNDAIKILLATDVASRGLDIDNVTHVINYDLPQTYEDYIHRIGRTGRGGKIGSALTFI